MQERRALLSLFQSTPDSLLPGDFITRRKSN